MKRNYTIAVLLCGMLVLGLASAQDKAADPATGENDEAINRAAVDRAALISDDEAIKKNNTERNRQDRAALISDDVATHDELRDLRKTLTEAVKKGDIDSQLAHVHKNVVATWQNNRVVRGTDGLRDFLKEMDAENKKVFQGYKIEPQVDEVTILYGGDTGVAFGNSVPQYTYLGMDFELENRWTATLVKEDGEWKIAAYHVSANVVDNPLLNIAKRSAYWAGGICLVVGLLVGSIGPALLRRRGQPKV